MSRCEAPAYALCVPLYAYLHMTYMHNRTRTPRDTKLACNGCSWRNLATPLASKEAVSPSRYPYLREFPNQNCQYQNWISLSLPLAWHISASACYFYFHSFFWYRWPAEFFSIFLPMQNWGEKSLWLSHWWTKEGIFFLAWRIFLQTKLN